MITNYGLIKFKGDNFYKCLSIVKSCGLRFDKQNKGWYGSQEQVQRAEEKLSQIEKIFKGGKTDEWKPAQSGITFNPELLKSPPLAEYQTKDIAEMVRYRGCLNFNEVGLGKTYETISAINHIDIDLLVIVTVTEAVYNWKRELIMFGNYSEEDILIVDRKSAKTDVFNTDKKVIIMDYHKTRTLTKVYTNLPLKKLREPVWEIRTAPERTAIVLDECHSIKNAQALQTKCLHAHRNKFGWKYLLSATPHPNGIEELWSQLYFWDEKFIDNTYYGFVRSIAAIGTAFSAQAIRYYYKDKVSAFLDKLRPYCLRREKATVLPDMPKQDIKKIFVEPSAEQLKIYDAVTEDFMLKLTEDGGLSTVQQEFPYLCLAASDPVLLKSRLKFGQTDVSKWKFTKNSKLAMCKELLKKHSNDKTIIWSSHPETCDLIAEYFGGLVMHGQTKIPSGMDKAQYRHDLIERFKSDKDCKIAVFNPAVMGTGVNMQFAKVNIYWDRSFDVKAYLQSLGRTHRANSEHDSIVYVLILDKTLEVLQDKTLDAKCGMNREALNKNFSMKRLTAALAGKIF